MTTMTGAYPFGLEVDEPMPQNRLSVLLRIFYIIPHIIVLYFLGLAAGVIYVISWFAILFTGGYPGGMMNFMVNVLHWQTRVSGYVYLLTDKYPPFSMGPDGAYPVRLLAMGQLEGRNRLTTFWPIRYILVIPHLIVLAVLGFAGRDRPPHRLGRSAYHWLCARRHAQLPCWHLALEHTPDGLLPASHRRISTLLAELRGNVPGARQGPLPPSPMTSPEPPPPPIVQPPAERYPVRFDVDYPGGLSRLSTAFRIILIIPISDLRVGRRQHRLLCPCGCLDRRLLSAQVSRLALHDRGRD